MFFEFGNGHGFAVVEQLEICGEQIRDRLSFSIRHVNLDEFERHRHLMLDGSLLFLGRLGLGLGTQEKTHKKTPR